MPPNRTPQGMSEEDAIKAHPNIDIYTSGFRPMRNTISGNPVRSFMKIIVDADSDKLLGMHMIGDNAAEIMQVRKWRGGGIVGGGDPCREMQNVLPVLNPPSPSFAPPGLCRLRQAGSHQGPDRRDRGHPPLLCRGVRDHALRVAQDPKRPARLSVCSIHPLAARKLRLRIPPPLPCSRCSIWLHITRKHTPAIASRRSCSCQLPRLPWIRQNRGRWVRTLTSCTPHTEQQ
jgi:hypothetical protein